MNDIISIVIGLAWLSGLCRKQISQCYDSSIQEDLLEAIIGHVVAHELGHNLCARHDGQYNLNNCSSDERHVMAPSVGATTNGKGTNHYIFSNCSVEYFQTYIDCMDGNDINCITSLSTSHDPTALDQYNKTFNGQIYEPNEQCQHYLNYLHYADPTTVCTYIYCLIPDNPSYCSMHLPWDGTVCGDGQIFWCAAGKCCNGTRAKSADPNCVLGDDPFCSADVQSSPFYCYYNYYNTIHCCGICQNYLTGITDCEYGDRSNDCVADDFPSYTANTRYVTCCKTCAVQTETTTTEPTTTKSTTTERTTTKATTMATTTTDFSTIESTTTRSTTTEPTTTKATTIVTTTTNSSTIESTTTRSTTTEPTTPKSTTMAITVTDATTTHGITENKSASDDMATNDDDILTTIVIPVVVTVGGVAVERALLMYFYVVKCKVLVEVGPMTT